MHAQLAPNRDKTFIPVPTQLGAECQCPVGTTARFASSHPRSCALSRIWRVQLKKSHPRSAFRAREHSAPSSDFTKWPSACSAQHAFKDMRCNHPMRALPPTLRHGHDAQHAHSLSDCISDPPRPLYPTLPSLQHDGARAVPRALTIISSWCSVTIDRQAVFPRAYHAHYIMFHCL